MDPSGRPGHSITEVALTLPKTPSSNNNMRKVSGLARLRWAESQQNDQHSLAWRGYFAAVDDFVRTGDGNDYVRAGHGNDFVDIGAGRDSIDAGFGDDIVMDDLA